MVLNATEGVVSLLLLILCGYVLYRRPWFGETGTGILSKFVVNVSIPFYMTYNVYTTFEGREQLLELFKALPIPLFTILVSLAAGVALSRLFHIDVKRRGVFINSCAFCNAVIVGFPVVQSLLGPEAMPEAMIYYMGNTILFWSVGVYFLRRDSDPDVRFFSLANLRKIFSPAINMFLLGCALVVFNVTIPHFIFSPLEMVSKTTTPLAMIFIGCVIRSTDFRAMPFSKDLAIILVSRFLFSPLLMFLVCVALPIPAQTKLVFFIFATMPAMTQLGIMARESGSDYHFASVVVGLTTLLSILAIPLYMALVQYAHLFGAA